MEVNSALGQKTSPAANQADTKKLSKEEILAKVKGKFGNKAGPKKAPAIVQNDPPEISDKAKRKGAKVEKGAGDIKNNDPKSEVTQEKLKNILRTGAFSFNENERQALSKILKM